MARKVQVLEGGLKSVEQIVQKSAEHLQTTSAADIDQVTGTNSDLREPHMQISTGTSTPAEDISASEWDSVSPIGHPTHAAPGVGFTSPYTHLLSLHESLRDELARITAALSDLDARHSMMILNENLRLKEDLTYLVGQVGGLGRQVGWLTSARLQQAEAASQRNAASASVASSAAAAARGVAGLARAAGFTGGSSTPPETTPATQAPAPANGPSISPVRMGRRLTDEGRTKL
ncbi:hypothetical protein ANO11243_033620 [Dothideomycetidae sp. 11243]|nr:hypothetical protein ANO11243_033620 [fungal sp. No.11243]